MKQYEVYVLIVTFDKCIIDLLYDCEKRGGKKASVIMHVTQDCTDFVHGVCIGELFSLFFDYTEMNKIN